MSIALVALGIVFVLALIYQRSRKTDVHLIQEPGGASFVWGHDKQIYEEDVGEAYRKWHNLYGNVIRLKGAFWHAPIISVVDPAALKHVLVTNIYDYHHSKVVRPRIERLLGRSLGWVEGAAEHKRMRKLVSPSFSTGNFKSMTDSIYGASRRNIENFVSHIRTHPRDEAVNIINWTQKATIMINGVFNFDFDMEAGESPHAQQIITSWRNMAHAMMLPQGFKALVTLRRLPFLNHVPIRANRKHLAVRETIEAEVGEALWRAVQAEKKDIARERSLLSHLNKAVINKSIERQEMLDHITMFMVAGFETTGLALAFSLWRLAQHPEKQDRLRKELMEFEKEPTYDDYLHSLPYLDAVCRESLRLHPSLAYMERVATKDDVLPLQQSVTSADGKEMTSIRIKAGQIIVLPIVTMHKLESCWDNPLSFVPERWLSPLPHEKNLLKTWSNELTFSDGPRQCIGQQLGLFMYKIILRDMILSMRFEDTGLEIGTKTGSSTQPYVKGRLEQGPFLPVRVAAIDH